MNGILRITPKAAAAPVISGIRVHAIFRRAAVTYSSARSRSVKRSKPVRQMRLPRKSPRNSPEDTDISH